MNPSASIDGETRMRISSNVYSRRFGDATVLLHFGRGDYFGLDAAGGVVWERCEAGDSLAEAAQALVRTFEVDFDTALADVLTLVAELRQADLVEPVRQK